MSEPPAEHLDRAWPGIGRTAIQQVADERAIRASAIERRYLRDWFLTAQHVEADGRFRWS